MFQSIRSVAALHCKKNWLLEQFFVTVGQNNFSKLLVDSILSAGPCLNDDLVADGYCDDETNNLACNYDGGDCCGFEVLEDYCDACDCLE